MLCLVASGLCIQPSTQRSTSKRGQASLSCYHRMLPAARACELSLACSFVSFPENCLSAIPVVCDTRIRFAALMCLICHTYLLQAGYP